jgi:hypothetical protein
LWKSWNRFECAVGGVRLFNTIQNLCFLFAPVNCDVHIYVPWWSCIYLTMNSLEMCTSDVCIFLLLQEWTACVFWMANNTCSGSEITLIFIPKTIGTDMKATSVLVSPRYIILQSVLPVTLMAPSLDVVISEI